MTEPMLQGASPGVQPCTVCGGSGEGAPLTLRLLQGRGANLIRHGAYARSVRKVGGLPVKTECGHCAGTKVEPPSPAQIIDAGLRVERGPR